MLIALCTLPSASSANTNNNNLCLSSDFRHLRAAAKLEERRRVFSLLTSDFCHLLSDYSHATIFTDDHAREPNPDHDQNDIQDKK